MKLKEWKAKRDDCSNIQSRALPTALDAFDGQEAIEAAPQCLQLDLEPTSVAQNAAASQQLISSVRTVAVESDSESPTPSSVSSQELYWRMRNDRFSVPHVTKAPHFVEGTKSLLHYAASQDCTLTFTNVLHLAAMMSVNIDLPDGTNSTALEVAIRAGKYDNIGLLLEAGASVSRTNTAGETPLQFATSCGATPGVYNVLTRYGANPNPTIGHPSQSSASLGLTVDFRLVHKAWLYLYTFYPADNSVYRRWEYSLSYKRFLDMLEQCTFFFSRPLDAKTKKCIRLCLQFFLHKDSDPLAQLRSPECIDGCDSLAKRIFFHNSNPEFVDVLIDNCNTKLYGAGLVATLLEPCPGIVPSRDKSRLISSLAHLCLRGIDFDALHNPVCFALEKSPHTEKVDLIEALLANSSLSIHTCRFPYGPPLAYLVRVEEPLRWQLAETILTRDVVLEKLMYGRCNHGDRKTLFIYDLRTQYESYTGNEYERYVSRYLYEFHRFFTPPNETELAIQCVIHVVTRFMIFDMASDPLIASAEAKLKAIRDMRQKYKLPAISIDEDWFLTNLEVTDLDTGERLIELT